MAFEFTKTIIHRIQASMGCGCKIVQEFSDAQYKESASERRFEFCSQHEETPVDISLLKFILEEFLDTEIKKMQIPVALLPQENKIVPTTPPGGHKPQPRVRPVLHRAPQPVMKDGEIEIDDSAGIDAMLNENNEKQE